MKSPKNQIGFSAVEIVLFLVIVGIIGFTGYKVMQSKQSVDNVSQSAVQTSAQKPVSSSDSTVAPVNSAADLDKAQKSLDQENPDDNSSDVAQFNSDTSGF